MIREDMSQEEWKRYLNLLAAKQYITVYSGKLILEMVTVKVASVHGGV